MFVLDERVQGCKGKIPYLTWDEAARVAKRLQRYRSEFTKPYRCKFCSGWHTGHPRKAR